MTVPGMNFTRNPLKTLALLVATMAGLAACVPPPPPVTYEVPNPGPGQTVPLKWAHSPAPTHVNLPYGSGPRQVSDIYLPTRGGNRGVIIAVHGGGFVEGTKDEVRNWFGSVMSQTHRGFAVMSVNYRLTSGNTNVFPAAVHDVNEAVRWVRAYGSEYGMNPHTVVVAGSSAGGTISALVGTGSNAPTNSALGRTEKVDGWVSYAGPTDFNNARADVVGIGRQWIGARSDVTGWLAAASPVTHIDPLDPPGYVVHGDHDSIVPIQQFDRMIEVAASKGITKRLYTDRVDTGGIDISRGEQIPCRWHLPMCGANHAVFNTWLDAVVARSL